MYFSRNRIKHKTLMSFVYANKYDIPALVTDFPGGTTDLGALRGFFILTKVGRMLRILRIFKVINVPP